MLEAAVSRPGPSCSGSLSSTSVTSTLPQASAGAYGGKCKPVAVQTAHQALEDMAFLTSFNHHNHHELSPTVTPTFQTMNPEM